MAKRPGRTMKLSISLDVRDVALLKKRAKQVSGGNVSAAIAQLIHAAQEWEGRLALAAWLGERHDEPSEAAMDAIRAEWRGTVRSKRRKKVA